MSELPKPVYRAWKLQEITPDNIVAVVTLECDHKVEVPMVMQDGGAFMHWRQQLVVCPYCTTGEEPETLAKCVCPN